MTCIDARSRRVAAAAVCALGALGWAAPSGAAGEPAAEAPAFAADALDFFEARVRPVLVEQCSACHGDAKQENGLRLDSRAAILAGGVSGPAAIAGDPANSRLVQAIRHEGALQMPPSGKLPDEAVDAIAHWVELGLPWPEEPAKPLDRMADRLDRAQRDHWAFQPIAEPAPPATQGDWGTSPIDQFVLARLEAAKLAPSPPADARTLARRLSFGLTGLPPTPEDVAALEADPNAYEVYVDRLLESPHYGERWARHWLDVARYADTKGYVFQEEREYGFAYTYRDYVIDAFNADLPYDTFLKHQLAADQMDLGEDKRPLAAMGFLTLGRRFINNIHDITDDRIDVVTRGMLGLTVSCARCHDHKYDPIGADDYYALYGVFRSSHEPDELPVIKDPDPGDAAYQDYQAALAEAEKALDDEVFAIRVDLMAHVRQQAADYLLAAHDTRAMDDGAARQALARDRSLRWQLVDRWRDYVKSRAESAEPDPIYGPWLAFAALADDAFGEAAPNLAEAIAANQWEGKPVNGVLARHFKGVSPDSMAAVAGVYRAAYAEADTAWTHRLAAHAHADAPRGLPDALADPTLEALRLELYGPDRPTHLSRADLEALSDVPTRNRILDRRNAIARVKGTHPGRPDRAMVMYDNAKPFNPHVFIRGNPGRKGPDVDRRFLTVLAKDGAPEPFARGSGRIELAEAIASADNPLTARVFVNRVWMYHFGEPLVETPSDFGLRSAPPSHPQLLDYLAARFIESGWSVKALHRMIVLSSTYRQSSAPNALAAAVDPENRLLWRQNRQRLDFEAMRDALLAVSGQLEAEPIGGRSVDITQAPYPRRRTVYAFIERQNLPGLFRTFDFAGPDTHSPARYTTTVPQQALYMLNSPFFIEQARALARREAVANAPCGCSQISALHELALQRPPSADDLALAQAFIENRSIVEGPPPSAAHAWHYGYGTVNPESGAVEAFTPFPHFTGTAYQGGPELPDATLGWTSLTAGGGHPGNDAAHAAIRRWVAPRAGRYAIEGRLTHGSAQGDGVTGFVVHNGTGVLWQATVHDGRAPLDLDSVAVEAGDTLDFVVFCGGTTSFDSFGWAPQVRASDPVDGPAVWAADEHFRGPDRGEAAPLTPLEQVAQVLLMTNEFHFVD